MEITIKVREKGKWCQRFDCCQSCKTCSKKHLAQGLCQACYSRTYRDMIKQSKLTKEANQYAYQRLRPSST